LSDDERSSLIRDNLGLAYSLANRFSRAFGAPVQEVASDGTYGLVLAAQRFDPKRGPFSAFAGKYIRGTILTGSVTEWRKRAPLISLETPCGKRGTIGDLLPAAPDSTASAGDLQATRRIVDHLLARLDAREKEIVVRSFGLGGKPAEPMSTLARHFGLSRMRVYQLRTAALAKMRKAPQLRLHAPHAERILHASPC
jgi:RNA polymerase sigma factor (sigma-70 family)